MSKVRKQMIINLLLVLGSSAVIVLAKSIPAGKLLPFGSYLGADIVFVVISSLISIIGWRYVENIHLGWWDVCSFISLIVFSCFYGAAIATLNEFVKDLILATLAVFPIMYIVENVMIYKCLLKRVKRKKDRNNDYLGQKYRDHKDE